LRVIIFEEVLRGIINGQSDTMQGILVGRVIDQGDIIQVFNVDSRDAIKGEDSIENAISSSHLKLEPIGFYLRLHGTVSSEKIGIIQEAARNEIFVAIQCPLVMLIEESQKGERVSTYLFVDHKSLELVDHNIVHPQSDIFERVRGIVDTNILLGKKVLVIGLGTGGSKVAVELAKCGVGAFILIDYDRIEPHNVSRHVCGIHDIGRLKTHAVRDVILQHNPLAKVETDNMDVLKSRMEFEQLVCSCDLVVAATGSPQVNNFTNDVCVRHQIPAIYAGAWERAQAGFVMRVIPGQTACFNCVHEILLKTAPPIDQRKIIDYSVITDPNELRSEPGLSIDTSIVALLQAKMALLTLVRGKDTGLEDIPQDYVLWLNKSYERFKPFTCLKIFTRRKDDCAVCNYENWFEKKSKSFR